MRGRSPGVVDDDDLTSSARRLLGLLLAQGKTVAFAESCTGGLLSSTLTGLAGASRVFWGGVVSYSEAAKMTILGVKAETIREKDIVSRQVVLEMASGLIKASGADLAVAVSGYAGPEAPAAEGGPGRVCFAWMDRDGKNKTEEERFTGERREIQLQAALYGLEGVCDFLER